MTTSDPSATPRSSSRPVDLIPAALLMATAVAWIPLERWLLGGVLAAAFLWSLRGAAAPVRRRLLALAGSIAVLAVAPIHTGLETQHFITLGIGFVLAVGVPTWLLRGERTAGSEPIITFKFWPDDVTKLDVAYTAASVPLAWAGIALYFRILAPEVAFNWMLPPESDQGHLLRLFLGINGVGIWDELFFVNVGYAVLRSLYPTRWANPLQSVLYTAVLYDMAFRGAGWPLVTLFALTQGAMYERSKALLWVLIAHLVVDWFLFQAIVTAYYPNLDVWWH